MSTNKHNILRPRKSKMVKLNLFLQCASIIEYWSAQLLTDLHGRSVWALGILFNGDVISGRTRRLAFEISPFGNSTVVASGRNVNKTFIAQLRRSFGNVVISLLLYPFPCAWPKSTRGMCRCKRVVVGSRCLAYSQRRSFLVCLYPIKAHKRLSIRLKRYGPHVSQAKPILCFRSIVPLPWRRASLPSSYMWVKIYVNASVENLNIMYLNSPAHQKQSWRHWRVNNASKTAKLYIFFNSSLAGCLERVTACCWCSEQRRILRSAEVCSLRCNVLLFCSGEWFLTSESAYLHFDNRQVAHDPQLCALCRWPKLRLCRATDGPGVNLFCTTHGHNLWRKSVVRAKANDIFINRCFRLTRKVQF